MKQKKKNRVLQLVISGAGFLTFSFCFLHTNMHHLILQELRKAANIPGFEKKKTMVVLRSLLRRVLCFRSVCFLSSPFCFLTISLISQFSYILLSCLPPVFLLTIAFPLFSLLSSPFVRLLLWLL